MALATSQYAPCKGWDARKMGRTVLQYRPAQAFPEPPAIYRQQDSMQQPHWNEAECHAVDEESDIAAYGDDAQRNYLFHTESCKN